MRKESRLPHCNSRLALHNWNCEKYLYILFLQNEILLNPEAFIMEISP